MKRIAAHEETSIPVARRHPGAPCWADAFAEESVLAAGTELSVGTNTIYLYAPESELPVRSVCTAPASIVFGSMACTVESAEATAVASGVAKLAAVEGATIAFVNPQGESWSDADTEVHGAPAGMYTNSTEVFTNGLTATNSILGESGRTYIYAEARARISSPLPM